MTGKLYRIGEAAALLDLKSYVLRFWETEFPQLEPVRTDKGQRLYTEEHIELLKLIKKLLHERGLTIDGARRILNSPESQKLRKEEDSFQLMASEFSSEIMLSGTYLPDDDDDGTSEEDEEQTKELLPQWLALLDDTIDELEEIRAMLAPLGDIVDKPIPLTSFRFPPEYK